PRVRIHGEGVRPRDRSDRRRPGQFHPADYDVVLQPLVPAIFLWGRRGTQQRAPRAGTDLCTGVLVAEPGLVEEQLGSGQMTGFATSRGLRWLLTPRGVA